MSSFKDIYVCRHAEKKSIEEGDGLTERGRLQSVELGKSIMREISDGRTIDYISHSPYKRTKETAEILERVLKPRFDFKSREDNDLRESIEFDSMVALRIRRAIENVLQGSGDVSVLVTHSGIIHSIKKLLGLCSPHCKFTPIEQGSFIKIRLPIASCFQHNRNAQTGEWRCETPETYMTAIRAVEKEKMQVHRKWPYVTETIAVTPDWEIIRDTWKEEKTLDRQGDKIESHLAIAKFDCASLRDLTEDHVSFLKEIERLYPESTHLKYIQYPPFVWKLHVHIIKMQNVPGAIPPSSLLKYQNTVLFSDVLKQLSTQCNYMSRNLLVFSPPYSSFRE